MKGYLKIFATVIIVLVVMILIGIILSFLFPNADHEKMGRSLGGIAIAIAFGMAMIGTIGKKKSKGEIIKKRKLLLALFVFIFLIAVLFGFWSNKPRRKESFSEQRINIFAQQLTSMTTRAKDYEGTENMSFVVFSKDDVFVQATVNNLEISFIDLPTNIMTDERVEILNEIFPNVHKNITASSKTGS